MEPINTANNKINWSSEQYFHIHMRLFTAKDGYLYHMMDVANQLYLCMRVELISIAGVSTNKEYKVWLEKDDTWGIVQTNSSMIENQNN